MPRNRKLQHNPCAPPKPDADIGRLPLEERIAHIAREHCLHMRRAALEPNHIAGLVADFEHTGRVPPGHSREVLKAFGNVLEIRRMVDALLALGNGNGGAGIHPTPERTETIAKQAVNGALAASPLKGAFEHRSLHGFPTVSDVSLPLRREIARIMGELADASGARELFEEIYHLPHEAVEEWIASVQYHGNGQGVH